MVRLSKASLSNMLRRSGMLDVYSGGVEWGARLGARSPVGWVGGELVVISICFLFVELDDLQFF